MYRIDNGSAAASLPASTAAGTAGYFTDGDPLTSTAPTILPAEWLNSIMLENLNVLTAAGITPAKNQFDQLKLAIQALVTAGSDKVNGQCDLRISGSDLILLPLKGNKLIINGSNYVIPAAGITLPVTGASASTMYYIYAYMSGATMTLERSATIYQTDNATGILTKTGDTTRTFVGWAKTNATPAWSIVRTYYNDTNGDIVLVFDGTSAAPIYTKGEISVTAIGTGEWTINVNMVDASYGFTATAQPPVGTSTVVVQEKTNTTKTSGQFQISAYVNTATPTLVDCPVITVSVFGKRLGD